MLAFIFAAAAPLWIPIDLYAMDGDTFYPMLSLRLAFSATLIILAMWGTKCALLKAAQFRLLAFIVVCGLFYVASRLLFGGGLPEEGILFGYSFLPFLLVALLAIVPLTLVEGVAYCVVVTMFLVATELYFGTFFSIHTMGDLWLLALLGAIALLVELTQLHMLLRLYREATRDVLTGLVNRRVLIRWLTNEIEKSNQGEGPVSVLLFDLDLFKRINDTYGHPAGDAVLQSFAKLLEGRVPTSGLVGRFGGEEFLAILPGCNESEAIAIAERVGEACRSSSVIDSSGDVPIRYTTSSGVAQWREGETTVELISRVDQGLYQAKSSGRDLVALAS
ncbi:hypothetical protein BOW53_16325 [Solemya pervernicosa gill symbiont]|uniref:diguanylate cyclase n=1 Tax=Solemya pervernicosa gill symbiont TaxID=642797 RepID=A0A1T2KZC3_9GAMM|nr:hypothetical protein BOW53_16325 [Solemya pervernicosa gill symbiont]